MSKYTRAGSGTSKLTRELKLEERIRALEVALRFYAEHENWWSYYDGVLDASKAERDGGDVGRAALSGEAPTGEEE